MAAVSVSWSMVMAVAVGGACGAVGRYLVGVAMFKLAGPGFPWGTMAVNVLGSLLMGLLIQTIAVKTDIPREVTAFLTVGLLGAFTTFSTFSLDAVALVERGQYVPAVAYVVGSVALGVIALLAGLGLARWVTT